jgi:hypothetical protein
MRRLQAGIVVLFSILLVGCASTPEPSKRDLIIGAWQAEFEGQAMTLEYGAENVTVREFGISFPYEWVDENNIRLNAMGQEVVSLVEFDSPDLMRQTAEGQQQVMRRVP